MTIAQYVDCVKRKSLTCHQAPEASKILWQVICATGLGCVIDARSSQEIRGYGDGNIGIETRR